MDFKSEPVLSDDSLELKLKEPAALKELQIYCVYAMVDVRTMRKYAMLGHTL